MTISLSKGSNINLSKEVPSLKRVRVALGWQINTTDTGNDYDLDVSAFMLKHNETPAGIRPMLISEKHFVFYNNLISPDGSVQHSGDNRTGSADIDDEVVFVDLTKMVEECSEVSFVVTIHEAIERKQNFGQVSNAYIRLIDEDKYQNLLVKTSSDVTAQIDCLSSAEVARFDLTEDFSRETALQFGSIYKHNGDWKFKAVGAGYNKGLDAFIVEYGYSASY